MMKVARPHMTNCAVPVLDLVAWKTRWMQVHAYSKSQEKSGGDMANHPEDFPFPSLSLSLQKVHHAL